ncbi:MAG: DUF2399 domain-containing protein [Streptosporangiaceae bacterium]
MNAQLQRVRTVSNLRVKLDWRVDPDLSAGMREARGLLLRDPASLSEADRGALHDFFRARVEEVRAADTAAGWEQQLFHVLDYRRWHQFVVLMDKGDDQGWVPVTKRRETPWDPALAEAVASRGVAVYEERVAETLLADLAAEAG